jgi:hypothetical protein
MPRSRRHAVIASSPGAVFAAPWPRPGAPPVLNLGGALSERLSH